MKPDHKENRAWLFTPDGQFAADYSKRHLVPGFEDAFVPGNEAVVRTIAAIRWVSPSARTWIFRVSAATTPRAASG
jgi:hypothetical protein